MTWKENGLRQRRQAVRRPTPSTVRVCEHRSRSRLRVSDPVIQSGTAAPSASQDVGDALRYKLKRVSLVLGSVIQERFGARVSENERSSQHKPCQSCAASHWKTIAKLA